MRQNLHRKITAGLLLPTSLLLVLFAVLSMVTILHARRVGEDREALADGRRVGAELSRLLQAAEVNAQNAAAISALPLEWSAASTRAILQAQLNNTPEQYGAGIIFLNNPQGKTQQLSLRREGEQLRAHDLSHNEWFVLAQKNAKPLWSPPYVDLDAGKLWLLTRAVPIFREQRLVGVATADVSVKSLETALQAAMPKASWLLLDAEGRIVMAPEARYHGRPYTDWAPANTDRAQFVATALGAQSTSLQRLDWPDGSSKLTSANPLSTLGWTLLLGSTTERLLHALPAMTLVVPVAADRHHHALDDVEMPWEEAVGV